MDVDNNRIIELERSEFLSRINNAEKRDKGF